MGLGDRRINHGPGAIEDDSGTDTEIKRRISVSVPRLLRPRDLYVCPRIILSPTFNCTLGDKSGPRQSPTTRGISHKKAQKSQKEVFKSLCVSCASLWPFLSVATLTQGEDPSECVRQDKLPHIGSARGFNSSVQKAWPIFHPYAFTSRTNLWVYRMVSFHKFQRPSC